MPKKQLKVCMEHELVAILRRSVLLIMVEIV